MYMFLPSHFTSQQRRADSEFIAFLSHDPVSEQELTTTLYAYCLHAVLSNKTRKQKE